MNWALARLIAAQICVHGSMAGMRLAAPLLALREGYSVAAVGFLVALFALTQVFLALPAGRYADRHGLKRPVGLQRQLGNAPMQVAAVTEYAQPSVCQNAAAPGLVKPGAGIRAPVGLFVVEPGGAALANLLGDQHPPAR